MLNCFSSCMFADESVMKRFRSNRSDWGKLRDRPAKSASGSGALKPLTTIQKWKLQNWAFMEPFIKKKNRQAQPEMGKVSIRNNLQTMFSLIHILLHLSHIFYVQSLLILLILNLSVVIAYASDRQQSARGRQ